METVVRSRGMVLVWIGSVIRSKFVLRNVSLDFYQTRKELGKVAPSILPPARSAPVSFSAPSTDKMSQIDRKLAPELAQVLSHFSLLTLYFHLKPISNLTRLMSSQVPNRKHQKISKTIKITIFYIWSILLDSCQIWLILVENFWFFTFSVEILRCPKISIKKHFSLLSKLHRSRFSVKIHFWNFRSKILFSSFGLEIHGLPPSYMAGYPSGSPRTVRIVNSDGLGLIVWISWLRRSKQD